MVASLYTPDSRVDSLVSRVKKLAGSVRSVKQRQKLGYALRGPLLDCIFRPGRIQHNKELPICGAAN